jgi:hypothetical protein
MMFARLPGEEMLHVPNCPQARPSGEGIRYRRFARRYSLIMSRTVLPLGIIGSTCSW